MKDDYTSPLVVALAAYGLLKIAEEILFGGRPKLQPVIIVTDEETSGYLKQLLDDEAEQ